jgi:hypothetical protein
MCWCYGRHWTCTSWRYQKQKTRFFFVFIRLTELWHDLVLTDYIIWTRSGQVIFGEVLAGHLTIDDSVYYNKVCISFFWWSELNWIELNWIELNKFSQWFYKKNESIDIFFSLDDCVRLLELERSSSICDESSISSCETSGRTLERIKSGYLTNNCHR